MVAHIKPIKMQIYINANKEAADEIKAKTGCDYLLSGGFYTMSTHTAICVLIADGVTYAYEWNGEGYSFDTNPLTHKWSSRTDKNFIYGVTLISGGEPRKPINYASAWGGEKERAAIGVKDGQVILYCDKTKITPEALQEYFISLGADSAIMLDGGGSVQGNFMGEKVTSIRPIHNYLCFWVDKAPKKKLVCLDAGHGVDTINGSPDGTYKEQEFTLDMAYRIKPLLERHGVDVLLTRTGDANPSLVSRVALANNAVANLFVSLHSNAAGNNGWYDADGLCVFANFPVGRSAAELLLTRMREAGVELFWSGLFDTEMYVLQNTVMPAYLVEYGFHTSQTDVPLLKSSAHRDKLAVATAKAILDHFGISWQEEASPPKITKEQANALIKAWLTDRLEEL